MNTLTYDPSIFSEQFKKFYHSSLFIRIIIYCFVAIVFFIDIKNKQLNGNQALLLSLFCTVGAMVVVLINLKVLVSFFMTKLILKKKPVLTFLPKGISTYFVLYFFIIVFFVWASTTFLELLAYKTNLLQSGERFPYILTITIYGGICLITTGLLKLENQESYIGWLIGKFLDKAVEKAQAQAMPSELEIHLDRIVIGTQSIRHYIRFKDILYIEADGNQQKIHVTNSPTVYADKSMNELEQQLPKDHFIRIHRQYIIPKQRVRKKDRKKLILLDDKNQSYKIPIGGDTFTEAIDKDDYLGF